MVEQIVNMKKRYMSLVQRYTQADFEAYFAEFFALHQTVIGVRWIQEQDARHLLIPQPDVSLSAAFMITHRDFDKELQGGWLDSASIDKYDKVKYPELYEAVVDLRKLFEASDVFEHVFGSDVDVTASKTRLIVREWE